MTTLKRQWVVILVLTEAISRHPHVQSAKQTGQWFESGRLENVNGNIRVHEMDHKSHPRSKRNFCTNYGFIENVS